LRHKSPVAAAEAANLQQEFAVVATEAGFLRQEFPLAAAVAGNFESKTTAAAIERAVLSQISTVAERQFPPFYPPAGC
jgi:hypothetical protein